MGTYADEEIEREIRETGDRIMREHLRRDELHGARREPAVDLAALRAFAAETEGLTVTTPSPHHVQVRQDGKVLAEWWPSKGTTMSNQKRGPVCRTTADFVEWLRSG